MSLSKITTRWCRLNCPSEAEFIISVVLLIVRKGFTIWKRQNGTEAFSLNSVFKFIALLASRDIYLNFKFEGRKCHLTFRAYLLCVFIHRRYLLKLKHFNLFRGATDKIRTRPSPFGGLPVTFGQDTTLGRLLWTGDHPIAETCTWQHKHLKRQISMTRWNLNPR
jgi:hypothetical protein